jgi:hypothetical protein
MSYRLRQEGISQTYDEKKLAQQTKSFTIYLEYANLAITSNGSGRFERKDPPLQTEMQVLIVVTAGNLIISVNSKLTYCFRLIKNCLGLHRKMISLLA